MSTPDRPLEGVRVLDLTRIVSGPLCTRILADLGADVIKVEDPRGDPARFVGPNVDGTGVYYAQMNAGKRNVSIDLKVSGARELVGELVSRCDVLVENYRPGVLDRLVDSPEELRAQFPELIICSISGWGQQGPWRTRPAFAPYVHAEVGLIEMTSRLRGTAPEAEVHQHADVYAGVMASNAITTALFRRARTGEGTHLDINMAQVAAYTDEWAAVELLRYEGTRRPFDSWTFPVMELGDGTPLSLMGDPVDALPYWVQVLGGPDDAALLSDPRFATREARAEHRDEVVKEVSSLVGRVADESALNVCIADHPLLGTRVQSLADLADSPWARAIGLVAEVRPGLPVPDAPWSADTSTIGARPIAASRGAHNAEVLAEVVGLDEDAIASLQANRVIDADMVAP
jgi:CoA:oxalate CoA-transferase